MRISSYRLFSACVVLLCLATFACITTSLNLAPQIRQHYLEVLPDSADRALAGLDPLALVQSPIHFQKYRALQLLNPSVVLDNAGVCANIQSAINLHLSAVSPQTSDILSNVADLALLHQCKELSFPTNVVEIVQIVLYAESVAQIHAGVKFLDAMVTLGYTQTFNYDDSYDWVDLLDLLTALFLSDGLSRSSVAVLSPSVHNTALILQTITRIAAHVDISSVPVREYLDKSVDTAAQLFSAANPLPNSCIAFPIAPEELVDIISSTYALITTYHAAQSSLPLKIPLQCLYAQASRLSVHTTAINTIYTQIQLQQLIERLYTQKQTPIAKLFQLVDLVDPTTLVAFSTPYEFPIDSTHVTAPIALVSAIPSLPLSFDQTQKCTVTLHGPSLSSPISITTSFSQLATAQLPVPASGLPLSTTYTIVVRSLNKKVIFAHDFVLRPATAANQQVVIPTVVLTIDNLVDSKITLAPPKQPVTATTALKNIPIDLSQHRQLTLTTSTPSRKNTLTSVRLVICDPSVVKSSACVSYAQTQSKFNLASRQDVAFFTTPKKSASTQQSAIFYFAAPVLRKLVASAGEHAVLFIDHTDLTTHTTSTVPVATIALTFSQPEDKARFFTLPSQTRDAAVDGPINSYLWDLVEHHFHTFSSPISFPPRIITLVFSIAIVAVALIGALIILGYLRPQLNNTLTAVDSIFALLFSVSLGSLLVGIFMYWLRFRLLDILLPATIITIPTSIVIFLALRWSVRGKRLVGQFSLQLADNNNTTTNKKNKNKKD